MSVKFKNARARSLLALAACLAAPAAWAVPVSLPGSSSVVINYERLPGDIISSFSTVLLQNGLTATYSVYDQLGATGALLRQFTDVWSPTTVWFDDGAFSIQVVTGPGTGPLTFDFNWQVVRLGSLVTIPGVVVVPAATVAEPSAFALAGAALALAAAARRRRTPAA